MNLMAFLLAPKANGNARGENLNVDFLGNDLIQLTVRGNGFSNRKFNSVTEKNIYEYIFLDS